MDIPRHILEPDPDSRAPAADLEPLEPVLPPEGIVATRLRDVAARVREAKRGGRVDVAGVQGSAAGAVLAACARGDVLHLVLVTADIEGARRAAEDAGFLVRGTIDDDEEDTARGEVLLLPANESSPYADVNPDRRAAMNRMATLFHLARLPWRVLVVPASGLARKVVPRSAVIKHAARVVAEDELDRDRLVRELAESGYLRVPVVEDPGSFAVRGALLDVWPPSSERPVRIELYGDLVVSMKEFDPYEQRTKAKDGEEVTLQELWLPPAREAILDPPAVARARARVQELADWIDWPTTRARALADDVTTGRSFFGAEGFLPAYYNELDPLFAFLPDDAVVVLDDPPAITSALREELERAEADAGAKANDPHFLPAAFYVDEARVVAELEQRRVVALHRTPVLGDPGEGIARYERADGAIDLASRNHDDLARAVKAARASRGKSGTLTPLVRRIHHWREHGLRVFVTARAQTQAERLTSLLRHQGIACRARLGTFDPAWLDEAGDLEKSGDAEKSGVRGVF